MGAAPPAQTGGQRGPQLEELATGRI